MANGKDFYGTDIAEVIEQACKSLEASREELAIEVLETGSAGIFGLCKKKAHIRVQRKAVSVHEEVEVLTAAAGLTKKKKTPIEKKLPIVTPTIVDPTKPEPAPAETATPPAPCPTAAVKIWEQEESDEQGENEQENEPDEFEVEPTTPVEPPPVESLAAIQADLQQLLTLMGLPSEVQVLFADQTVQCTIIGEHEAQIVGPDGRTLDSMQYLFRKMVSQHLPDRIMLALNAGDFRERRACALQAQALELAAMVKTDGKTQAIAALNPSERRVVHMVLQEDKEVRSRSVGEGLFKKVLIYKAGKGGRPPAAPRKRRGGQGGRASSD
jgi:spoIIIJ-associated protein